MESIMQLLKTAGLAVMLAAAGSLAATAQDDRPVITIGVSTLPEGLDPGLNVSNVAQRINYSIFDELIKRAHWEGENGDGAGLAPSIATAWRNVEPTTWEVDIRTDVFFHNGETLTAEDVAFSFGEERMWGAERIVAVGPTYFGNFTGVEVVDEDTVRFTTAKPDPIFPKRFTATLGKVVPMEYYSEVGVDKFNLEPIGTGPYKLAEFRQHEMIRLVAHDEYWGGRPPAAEIVFLEIPEEAGRITGLLNGELDIIANISPDQQGVIAGADGAELMPVIIDNSRIAMFNTVEPPVDDANLRRAMIHAIDREGVVDALWGGQSRVPRDLNFTSHGEDYLADRPMVTYDPEEAQRLLEASDYNGEEIIFRIHEGYYTNFEETAQVFQQMWQAAGINVKLELRDNGAAAREGAYHLVSWSNGMQIVDITHPVNNVYGRTSVRTMPDHVNYVWSPSERLFELLDLMETTLDHERRMAYFTESLDIIEAEAPQIELFQAVEYYGVRDGINWKPYSFWPMDLGPLNLSFD
jgi:peptide/nickel transport system substrate-binding protein